MSIILNKGMRVIVQGLTGKQASVHTELCLAYGTNIVGGVSPGKGGTMHLGLPVFNTVAEAIDATQAEASIIFVPAARCKYALFEAIDALLPLVVCITEGIPVWDMLEVKEKLLKSSTRLIGPNCPGIIVPGVAKLGIMPSLIHTPGRVAILSRSGTLTYEVVEQTTKLKLGQSICIGVGGDSIVGSRFVDILPLLEQDLTTEAIVLVGEIGGNAEEEATLWIKKHATKPIIAYIAGVTAPPGRRMGHAGAIIAQGMGSIESKRHAYMDAHVHLVDNPARIGQKVYDLL